jgi:hypothetical protein
MKDILIDDMLEDSEFLWKIVLLVGGSVFVD